MGIIDQICLYEEKEEGLKLYIDMDGVLTDWDLAFENLGDEVTHGLNGEKFEEKFGKVRMWQMINKYGKLDFWENMPWMKDGKELWNYVKKFNPTILTTPARSKMSKEGKKIWIARELGKDIPYILEKDKYKYADVNSVLIDDYDKKIKDWVEKGDGIGIHHLNTKDTIKQLKQLGF